MLVQCSVERDIRTLDFDGKTLTERPEAVVEDAEMPARCHGDLQGALILSLIGSAWHRT